MKKILPKRFFDRPAAAVARDLLGKYLIRKRGDRLQALMITEAEAYDGFTDKASHAHRGQTRRNEPMFGPAGRWYIYFVYGMHWMLNVVTGGRGYPAAVLIRGVEGISGPARSTRALGIDGRLNGRSAAKRTGLWVEDRGVRMPAGRVGCGPRIGVAYAGEWAAKPLRFFIRK
jgi:DNA-3-methyladenine glycosylase